MLFLPSLSGGGAERVLTQLANEFFISGHEVHLVVASGRDCVYLSEVKPGVKLTLLGSNRTLHAIPKLAKLIYSHKPTVLLTSMGHAAVICKLALLLCGRSKTRFYIREAIAFEYKLAQMNNNKSRLFHLIIGWTYRRANGVIGTNKAMSLGLVDGYRLSKSVSTIPNPVIASDFKCSVQAPLEQPIPWNQKVRIVITAGRLCKQKDFDTLIRAFAKLCDQKDLRLIILGEGELRSDLESTIQELNISDRCWLPGFVCNPLPYFALADVFVLSSINEGLPNVLIQALATGTPCVSTDCPTGPADVLKNGKYGHLVPVGDEVQLATSIDKTLSGGRAALSPKIVEGIYKRYDAKRVASEYLRTMGVSD